MLSDLKASQLISESLLRELSAEELIELQQHLDSNPTSQNFKKISEWIQVSARGQANAMDDDDSNPGLTDQAKQRLKDSIRMAQSGPTHSIELPDRTSSSQSFADEQHTEVLVAETRTPYAASSDKKPIDVTGKRTLADAIFEHFKKDQSRKDKELGLHRLIQAFLGVCQVITSAHSKGVIHCDLRPDHVAVDNLGQVVVLNWGLAKLLDDTKSNLRLGIIDAEMSQMIRRDIIKTHLFRAPEQAASQQQDCDQQTDIYGLGAILFAVLTGSAPHDESLRGSGNSIVLKVVKSIAENDSPRPSDFAESLPAELENICLKAMQLNRHERYDSVVAMANDVGRWIAEHS